VSLRRTSSAQQAVVCGPDGVAIFDALHRHGTVSDGDAVRLGTQRAHR
jgi:hypothetical protein